MGEVNLPLDWQNCALGDLLTGIQTGKSVRCDERPPQLQEKGLIKISAVTWGEFNENESKTLLSTDHLQSSHKIDIGDLLISRANTLELVGACVMVKNLSKNLYLSDKVLRLEIDNLLKPLVLRYLNSKDARIQIESLATGNQLSMRNISQDAIRAIRLPLPPLAEQKVIAEKLDTLLAQVDNTKARLERIPEILKSFRQSVLAAAVSGKLSEEWRSNASIEPRDYSQIAIEERKLRGIRETKHSKIANTEEIPFEIPDSWQWFRLGNLALKITDGAHNTPKVLNEGFPYIMAKDLTVGFLDFSEKRYISEKEHRELYLKCVPERDDLLVVNIGAGTGNNVLVDVDFEFSFKNIAIIKRPSFIIGKYLKCFFDSQKQRIFDEQTRGGAQPFLSLTVLNELAFALPSREEQTEIVRRVEQLFAFADSIEQRANAALARVNNLTQSILAKAFRGELTADWRAANSDLISGDNSAEALLAKIKAERAKLAKKAKAKA
ncbi:restriction endonuclease subunit S [Rheinheimera sp.]|uniref:restriction endonuclease subunit S n=1 Tax=Rheinheimera sp. TaxID=1869214 RepID=UPI00307FB7B3